MSDYTRISASARRRNARLAVRCPGKDAHLIAYVMQTRDGDHVLIEPNGTEIARRSTGGDLFWRCRCSNGPIPWAALDNALATKRHGAPWVLHNAS